MAISWLDGFIQLVITTVGVFLALAGQAALESRQARRAAARRAARRAEIEAILEEDIARLAKEAAFLIRFDLEHAEGKLPLARLQHMAQSLGVPRWHLLRTEYLSLEPPHDRAATLLAFYRRVEAFLQSVDRASTAPPFTVDRDAVVVAHLDLGDILVEGTFALRDSKTGKAQKASAELQAEVDAFQSLRLARLPSGAIVPAPVG